MTAIADRRSAACGASPPTFGRACSTTLGFPTRSNGSSAIPGAYRYCDPLRVCRRTGDDDEGAVDTVFRILQEAFTNILRHSRATRVHVWAGVESGVFTLRVRDNGRGISDEERSAVRSLGILGMGERAALVGATFDITGVPGQGTTITVRVPLRAGGGRGQAMSNVLLVDDHQVVRDGLKTIIREQGIGDEFGEATTAVEALKMAAEHPWDLADRRHFARRSKRTGGRARAQTAASTNAGTHAEHAFGRTVRRRAYKAGAAGYITKDSSRAELAGAIAKVIAGGRYISPALAEHLVMDLERDADRPAHHALSNREFEVMRLIGSGKTVGEIAEMLSLSDKTVSTYRARILEKLHLNTTAELIRYVVENKLDGLVSQDVGPA